VVHMEYIFHIFNRSFVSGVWEIIQMNFYVNCNYIEVFNMSVLGTDFLRGVVYK
jgi:hypothetical protein